MAQPYLDRGLNRSLFDVSALARDGVRDGAPIPVALTYAGGTRPVAPAGVSPSSVDGTSARGTLAPGSGQRFAAAA